MNETDRPHQTTRISIGERSYALHNIAPSSLVELSFRQLVEELQRICSTTTIALLSAPLFEYAGEDDKDSPWFRIGLFDSPTFDLNALASSLVDAVVFEFSPELADHLSLQETRARLVVTPRAAGLRLLRELHFACAKVKHFASIDLVPVAAFQSFRKLWSPSLSNSAIQSEAFRLQHRFIYTSGLGESLGTMHSRGSLHGDVHAGNFLLTRANVVIPVDAETGRFPLLIPTSHQCANDIASLLSDLDAFDWEWFKTGYVSARGLDGQFVINLIETGHEQKGATLIAKDPASALPLLLQELEELTAKDNPDLSATYCNLGYCYSLLSQHAQAVAAYQKALEYFDETEDVNLKMLLRHNFGIALHRMGDYRNAAKQLECVHVNREIIEDASGLYERTLQHLFDCYVRMEEREKAVLLANEIVALTEKKT